MDTELSIGSKYSLTVPFETPNELNVAETIKKKADELGIDFLDDLLSDDLHIDGVVVYNNGVTAIVKVESMNTELETHVVGYKTLRRVFPDYMEDSFKCITRYYCIDIKSGISLFNHDYFKPGMYMARFNEDHNFDGYTLMDDEDYQNMWFAGIKREFMHDISQYSKDNIVIDINHSDYDDMLKMFNLHEEQNVSEKKEDLLEHSVNRTLHWLSNYDCAILTAWRSTNHRKDNNDRNVELVNKLKGFGYGVIKVVGYYGEVGRNISKENSFLVIDMKNNPGSFLEILYGLSEKFDQDSFLYKEKGELTPAFLIGTNDDFGKMKIEKAGYLHVNVSEAKTYTKVGSGLISFENS